MDSGTTTPPMIQDGPQTTTLLRTTSKTQSFHPFPRLPTEIRLKIWSYASRFPRVLELQYCIVSQYFFTFQHLPSVLHTNHESRIVGLTYYHLSFATAKASANTYFNPSTDIIYFGSRQYGDEIAAIINHFQKNANALEEKDQIQNLALAEHLWRRQDKCGPGPCKCGPPFTTKKGPWSIPNFHRSFPGLRKLIFVKGPLNVDKADEESSEVEADFESYTGLPLVESTFDEKVLEDSTTLAVEPAMSYFASKRLKNPDQLYPEVVAMEYGLSKECFLPRSEM